MSTKKLSAVAAATFAWSVSSLHCFPNADGQTNVVNNVTWLCVGEQTAPDGTVYRGQHSGNTPVAVDEASTFTPFDQLTADQVLGWVWGAVKRDEIEAIVQAQINDQITPPVVALDPPWMKPAEEEVDAHE